MLDDPSSDSDMEGTFISIINAEHNGVFAISKALMDQEKAYLLKNKSIQKKSIQLVKEAEKAVKLGLFKIENQSSEAAELSELPRTRLSSSGEKGKKAIISTTRPSSGGLVSAIPVPLTDAMLIPIIPLVDENIGQEAMNRVLKAKLLVLQQDFEKMTKFYQAKESSILTMEQQSKGMEDAKNTAIKANQKSLALIEKLKKQNCDVKVKNETLETSLENLKRDYNTHSRTQRQYEVDASSQSLKLNRALEEIEKNRGYVAKIQEECRISVEVAKQSSQALHLDLLRCEKQKGDLIAVFKKQQQLIDVLKRQKQHTEAATLLQFTEQEFLRALDSQ